jgi:hypothetical protein
MPAPGTSGATLGALDLSTFDDALGIERKVLDIAGWGAPATTLDPRQKPRGHGSWSGESWLRPRVMVIKGSIKGSDALAVSLARDALYAACGLGPTLLTVYESGRARSCMVRQQDEIIPTVLNSTHFLYSMQVVADDPRKYGPALSLATALPSSSGGLTLPMVLPYIFASTTVSGVVSLTNEGNISSPLTVRFDGPVTGPKIIHIQTQKTWAAGGAVLGAGEFWTVSMDSRQVLAQGQASRSGFVTERGWMELLPGPNDFAFSADSYNAASQMTVTAASAWK